MGQIQIYSENGIYGDLKDRPVLDELLANMRPGLIDRAITVPLDRLIIDLMLQENIIAVLLAKRDEEYSPPQSTNRFIRLRR